MMEISPSLFRLLIIKRGPSPIIFWLFCLFLSSRIQAGEWNIREWDGDHALILSDERKVLLPNIEILLPQAASGEEWSIASVEESGLPDKYGRQPALVRLADGQDIREILLARGWARLHPRIGDPPLSDSLRAREKEARLGAKGLWNQDNYKARPADDPVLPRFLGHYQWVVGIVENIQTFGGTTQINLDGKINARIDSKAMGMPLDLPSLSGHRIAIRGWLGNFRGLIVKIARWDQIELEP